MNTNRIRLAVDVADIMTEVMGPDCKGIFFCSTIDEADTLGAKYMSTVYRTQNFLMVLKQRTKLNGSLEILSG
jgi:hypothetical protein